MEPMPEPNPSPTMLSQMPNAVKLIAGAAAGALSIGVAAVAFGAWPFWLQATLWAGACSSIGWIIGFLFGIPRTEPTAATAVANSAIRLSVNTNLEQISDWLTKIIVGVTLTQWNAFITQLDFASKLIALSLGGAHMQSFAYALMVYFAATGFLSSYLLTRVFLQAVLGDAADGNNGN